MTPPVAMSSQFIETKGIPRWESFTEDSRKILLVINSQMSILEGNLVKASPSGIGGKLRQSWQFLPALPTNPVAIVGTSTQYFLPVEMGRKPGKGINREGQEAVKLWAKRKLGLSPQESKGFAYNLSQKYKRQGRPASGFAGLAKPGSIPQGDARVDQNINPITGSLIDRAFKAIDRQLNSIR